MSNFFSRDTISSGMITGLLLVIVLYVTLKLIDILFKAGFDRPLFSKPDALQLIILASLALSFRQKFKKEHLESGKGVFVVTFVSTFMYLLLKKYNFALWPNFD